MLTALSTEEQVIDTVGFWARLLASNTFYLLAVLRLLPLKEWGG